MPFGLQVTGCTHRLFAIDRSSRHRSWGSDVLFHLCYMLGENIDNCLEVKCRKFVVCHLHRRIVLSQDLLFHPSILCLANFCGVCCYLSWCRYCSIVFFQPQRLGRWTLCGRLLNISARCDFSPAIVLEMEDKLYNIAPVDGSAAFYCCGMKSRLSGRLMTVASWDGWEINALNRH